MIQIRLQCLSVDAVRRFGSVARIIALVAIVASGCGSLRAQLSSANISGEARDAGNASVSAVDVALTNSDTGIVRKTKTNSAGVYSFTSIPPGRYKVGFTAAGFKTSVIDNLTVTVGESATVNGNLVVGGVAETVSVTTDDAPLESSSSQLGLVVSQKQIADLPLNGRNFTQLLQLTPGAVPISVGQNSAGNATPVTQGSSFSFPAVNGQDNRSNYFMLDGLNDLQSYNGTYVVAPIVDTIQEFKVSSHSDQSEFGGVTGGVINVVTRSGTNRLHGGAWEYLRNNYFDSKNHFLTKVTPYHQNQFGGMLGGPVVLPKIYNGHNKTFFFVAAEGFTYSMPQNTFQRVPTEAELNGDFSATATPLYDPFSTRETTPGSGVFTRTAFAGNQIPASRLNKQAIAFARAALPAARTIAGTTAYNALNETALTEQQQNYSGRIDHTFGSRDFIFFRYSGQRHLVNTPGNVASLITYTNQPSEQYGGSWVHTFSPTFTIQSQYSHAHIAQSRRASFSVGGLADTYGAAATLASSFIQDSRLAPNLTVTGFFSGGESLNNGSNYTNTHEYKVALTKTFGRHEFAFGGSWNQINFQQVQESATVTFLGTPTGNPTNTAQSGNALASFLLNVPNSAARRNVYITLRPGGIMGYYFSDRYKISPKLTVNAGLRWDRTFMPPYGTDESVGKQGSIETGDMDLTNGTYIVQQLPPLCSVRLAAPCLPSATLPEHVIVSPNRKIIHDQNSNFGPRIGAAYQATDKTTVSAGFGIYFNNWATGTQIAQNYQGSWPDIGSLSVTNLNTPTSANPTPNVTGQDPLGTTGFFPAATPFTQDNYFVDPHFKIPYSEQWTAGLQQQFGGTTVLHLNYVGSQSHHTDVGGYYNVATTPGPGDYHLRAPFPYINATHYDRSAGNGNYNALQASVERRMSRGLVYQLAYTWSKSIDSGSSGWYGAEGFSVQNPYDLRSSRSVSAYNIPHLFTANGNYQLPFGEGRFRTGSRFVNYAISHWQTNAIVTARSGQNYNLTVSGDIANTGNTGYMRPNRVGDPNIGSRSASKWFNTAAYAIPSQYTFGSEGRNSLQASNYWNADFSVVRSFPFRELIHLDFRAETFNVFNTVIFAAPASNISTPSTFGVVSTMANAPRSMQFALKLGF
jgi:hypothetical protein